MENFTQEKITKEKKKIVSVIVCLHGVKGRDRKTKFHCKELFELEPSDVKDSAIESAARDYLGRNFKSVTRAWVDYHNAELDGIFKSTNMMPFKKIKLIGFVDAVGGMI